MIDLRSDTVTKPSKEMLGQMLKADVGDDVYREDLTVIALETMVADKMGMEAAVFTSSGTQANLLALLTHCDRGDEYITGQNAHNYKCEAGGAAVLGSIQPQPLSFEEDGTLNLNDVLQFIKPADDYHFARTKLLCLENTNSGLALPLDYLHRAKTFVKDNGLNFHLDGARIFNAALKTDVHAYEISRLFDTVSVCFSKGLGAPVGSALCGSEGQIEEARRWRKMLGGGMRQAGLLAGACIYALENNIERLVQDHENASMLAAGLSEIEQLSVMYTPAQTNMVFVEPKIMCPGLGDFMHEHGISIPRKQKMRLVTHLNISSENIRDAVTAFKEYFSDR